MKKISHHIWIALIFVLVSCRQPDKLVLIKYQNVKINITNVQRGKYTRIEGYFKTPDDSVAVYVSNKLQGYYYRTYCLNVGDTIVETVECEKTYYRNRQNPNIYDVWIRSREIDFSRYECRRILKSE